jgi:site-specific recombinase XerD
LITRHNPAVFSDWFHHHSQEEITMTAQLFSNPTTFEQLHVGPLKTHIAAYARWLSAQGYARATAREHLQLLSHLSQWCEQRQVTGNDLSEQQLRPFLQQRQDQSRVPRSNMTILTQFLEVLREVGMLPAATVASEQSNGQGWVHNYAHYLVHERGLTSATVASYLPIVQRFLNTRFGTEAIDLEALTARDASRFLLDHTPAVSPKRAKLIVSALRSFLRFLYQRGGLATDLALSLPAVADWRLSSLPKFIAPDEVERLLQSCDQTHPTGRRDYAILLLLARLGLRAGEVVAMTLEDLDWTAGELTVRGKGGRRDRLPIPPEVGQALATYLRHGRPSCQTRRVFVRMKAPRQGFTDHRAISTLVHRALTRAGLAPALKGAHLLRHSLATQMLRGGASLAEIGDLLRHQSPMTTEIYAKVDQTALAALAHPWLGEEA